jgi:hypothetical protein
LFRSYHQVIERRGITADNRRRKESTTAEVAMNHTVDGLNLKEVRGRNTGMSVHSSSTPKSSRINFVFRKERPKVHSVVDPFP